MLRFASHPDKMVNAMAFFAEACPGSTKMKLFKLMYFADKEHLLRYGRPITGDRYVRMQFGPTPSSSYNMIKGEAPYFGDMALFQSKLAVLGNHVRTLHSPDMKVFSRSDEKVLKEIAEKYGRKTAAKLSDLSHEEPTWKKTAENEFINFELMFEGQPDAALTLELLTKEHSQTAHGPK